MERYEKIERKKMSRVFVIIVLLILMVSILIFYQRNEPTIKGETTTLVVPIKLEVKPENDSSIVEEKHPPTLADDKNPITLPICVQNKESVLDSNVDLATSDKPFKLALTALSDNLTEWFSVKDVIKKSIVIVNDLSQSQIVHKHRKFLKMSQAMQVKQEGGSLYIAEKSYQRYNVLANAIVAIDEQKALAFYVKFKPLFKQVYDNFSYPENYRLEDIFIKALSVITQSPVIEKRIKVVRHAIGYRFADKNLEAMNAVDKQMLRMGPANTRKIQTKAKQLIQAMSTLCE